MLDLEVLKTNPLVTNYDPNEPIASTVLEAIVEKRVHNLNRLTYEFTSSPLFAPDYGEFEELFEFFLNSGWETAAKKVWTDCMDKCIELDKFYKNKTIGREGYLEYMALLSKHFQVDRMRYGQQDYVPYRFGYTKRDLYPGILDDLTLVNEWLMLFSNSLRTGDYTELSNTELTYRYFIVAGWFYMEVGLPSYSIVISRLFLKIIQLIIEDKIPNNFEIDNITSVRYRSSMLWLQIMGYYQLGNMEMFRGSVNRFIDQASMVVHATLNNRFLEAAVFLYNIEPSKDLLNKIKKISVLVRTQTPNEPTESVRERLLVLFDIYNTNLWKELL